MSNYGQVGITYIHIQSRFRLCFFFLFFFVNKRDKRRAFSINPIHELKRAVRRVYRRGMSQVYRDLLSSKLMTQTRSGNVWFEFVETDQNKRRILS